MANVILMLHIKKKGISLPILLYTFHDKNTIYILGYSNNILTTGPHIQLPIDNIYYPTCQTEGARLACFVASD
jgi:hypothetical protein